MKVLYGLQDIQIQVALQSENVNVTTAKSIKIYKFYMTYSVRKRSPKGHEVVAYRLYVNHIYQCYFKNQEIPCET